MAKSLPITETNVLQKLYTDKMQHRDPAVSVLRPIHALDTETYNGDIFLIADSEKRYLDNIDAKTVIDFLFSKRFEGSWNFFFNIGYDAEVVLKLLGKELFSYAKTTRLSFRYEDYRLVYILNKCLKILKGHHSVAFYDIAQFFGSSLVKAYEDNIGKLDGEYLKFKNQRTPFSPRFYRRNTLDVRNYCIRDCQLTKELAEKWIRLFHDAFGFYPLKWI